MLRSTRRPTLIRIETKAGHGGETPSKQIEEATDLWAFALQELGITADGPVSSAGRP